jgi:hypothetical protein
MPSTFTENCPPLAVTTGANDNVVTSDEAERLAIELNAPFIPRHGRGFDSLFRESGAEILLVIRRDRYSLHNRRGIQYQFHPNLAIVRAMNFTKTGNDHYLEAAELKSGDRVIDCTLGFGCEALLASLAVGEGGQVIGLESVPELAVVTRDGMSRYHLLQRPLEEAMRRVVVLSRDYRDYLMQTLTNAVDVVYFDPFFPETLEKSTVTVGALSAFGNRAPLDYRSVIEARRVAKRRVIIKHPKSFDLPPEVIAHTSDIISGRKSPVAYAVLPGFSAAD